MALKRTRQLDRIRRRFFVLNFLKYVALMTIPVLAISVTSICLVRENISRQIKMNTETIFSLSTNALEQMIFESRRIGIYINAHSDILLSLFSLFNGETPGGEGARALDEYENYIDEQTTYAPYIHSVLLFNENSDYLLVNSSVMKTADIANYDLKKNTKLKGRSSSISKNVIRLNSADRTGTTVVSFSIPLKYSMILMVNVRESYLRDLLDNSTQYYDEILLITDSCSGVIAGNSAYQSAPSVPSPEDEKSYIVLRREIQKSGSELVSFIPESTAMQAPKLIIRTTFIFTLVAILLSFMISFILSRKMYCKINRILVLFEGNEGADGILPRHLDIHFDIYHYILEHIGANYVRETRLREEIVRGQLDLANTQLTALQYQINPHFIFNTLQSIDNVMKMPGRTGEASMMINSFSQILRYSLQSPLTLVPLPAEIDVSRKYIALQSVRFRDRAMIMWDYEEEDIKDAFSIRMLFQPIIENVYQHGLSDGDRTTFVNILIERKKDRLFITVTDDAPGPDDCTIAEINDNLSASSPPEHHIGLYNVSRRLLIMFGEESRIRVSHDSSHGFIISTSIPVVPEEK